MREGVSWARPHPLVLTELEQDLEAYRGEDLLSHETDSLITRWKEQVSREPARFIQEDGSVRRKALRDFRRLQIFVPDNPKHDPSSWDPQNWLGGGRRGDRRMLRECLDLFLEFGEEDLLRKYPCHPAGNPFVFQYKGYRFTHRWLKHLYSLGLFNRVLAPRLPPDFTCLDIGSSYGVMTYLLRREHPHSRHILIDFPEQLLLARYFLKSSLPALRVASLSKWGGGKSLTRSELLGYDVILLPCGSYGRIEPGFVDVVMNFASLGEMTRAGFERYLDSEQFRQARFFFTANRVESRPTYDTDLTILDYPIWDQEKKLHFGVSPLLTHFNWYRRQALFFYERMNSHPYFEYIGRISG